MPSLRTIELEEPGALTGRLFQELPYEWWSVDPGDVNVGLSRWTGPVCFSSFHTNPNDFADFLEECAWAGVVQLVVYEAFNLQGDKMGQQQGSEFLTSQLIGVIKRICRQTDVPTVSYRPSDHKGLFKQSDFRPPKRPHTEWRSYGQGGHAKDSENLGEYHVRKVIKRGSGY